MKEISWKWVAFFVILVITLYAIGVNVSVDVEADMNTVEPDVEYVYVEIDRTETHHELYLSWIMSNSDLPDTEAVEIYNVIKSHPYPELMMALIAVESNFNPHAKSNKGAMGLTQIMPTVWGEQLKRHGIIKNVRDLYLVEPNIKAGIYVLTKYIKQTGSLSKALYKYVGGSSDYVSKVLSNLGDIYLLSSKTGE